jgi:uncharacterized protein YvpB
MSSTVATTTVLDAQRSAVASTTPSRSRTPYRAAPDTTFGAALRAAATEAIVAQYGRPSAAPIAAPVEARASTEPAATPTDRAALPPAPAGFDPRLWESLLRGPGMPIAPNAVPRAPEAANARPTQIDAATARAHGQAFLASIKGFDQTKANEYESAAQAKAWGYSTCSAASLTAVLRAAGQDVKIADVMKAMPGGMTIKLGLVSRPSLVNAANQFGAKATDDVTSYEALKQATDNGQPVLVDIRNSKFPEGHWIVVTGVDENGITCADSSRYDLTSISRGDFQRSWSSRGIRLEGLTPTAAPARTNVQAA